VTGEVEVFVFLFVLLFTSPLTPRKIHVDPFPESPCNFFGALNNKILGFSNIKKVLVKKPKN